MTARFQVTELTIKTPSGRTLFDALELGLPEGRVALVGRNGVGKSTLLSVLAGQLEPHSGRVSTSSPPHFVPQLLARSASLELSHGELRRRALVDASTSGADLMLLDEPSEDLDEEALAWLRGWLREFSGCLLVASHDRRLLADFEHFCIVSESGCRYFRGTLSELDAELESEREALERRYLRNLNRLASAEEHALQVLRRKARKKRHGRSSELDRATPRIRLNQKRSDAQVSHGRLAKLREKRLDALRQWSRAARRALSVRLPLELVLPALPDTSQEVLTLRQVSAKRSERVLFESLDLRLGRQRVAVTGPNGAGKTTLLEIALGRRTPSSGSVQREPSRIGSIAQGAADWMLDDSLMTLLGQARSSSDDEQPARVLAAHKFPLALAQRPLSSLSPGERTRAALICLLQRSPAVELLILDEPTFSLDLLSQRALAEALKSWQGGLVVASHDRTFLAAIDASTVIELRR